MKRGLKRVIITVAGIAMFTTTFATTTYAAEVDLKLQTVAVQKNVEKLNSEKLIVLERDVYKRILSGDTAIIENKDNLLIIDSQNITPDELDVIKSSESFYLFGAFNGDISGLESLDNYANGLYGPTKYESAVQVANENKEQDVIFVNGESEVDYFVATQLGNIENKNVLLVNEELTEETKEYLINNGSGKTITFLEGASKISEKAKEEIMSNYGGVKYELGTSQIIKSVKEKNAKANESAGELVANSIKSNTSDEEEKSDSDTKADDAKSKLINASSNLTKKNSASEQLIYNKGKIISFEELTSEETVEKQAAVKDFVATIDKNLTSTKVLNDGEITDEKVDGYSLQITQVKPIDIDSSAQDGKKEFLVPQETNDEIVNKVINGDYGNGADRATQLTKEGFNSKEIQNKIKERLGAEVQAEQIVENEAAEQIAANEAAEQIVANEAAEQIQVTQTQETQQVQTEISQVPTIKNASQDSKVNSVNKVSKNVVGVESFINEALKMNGWAYSQEKRMQNGFVDCSSLVVRAMVKSGFTGNNANLTTYSMPSDSRFYEVPMSQMSRGDILWTNDHMEIYMGNGTTFGAFRPGKATGYAGNPGRFVKAYRLSGL